MFNMTKIKAVRGDGRSFYMNHLSSNDYYSENEKVKGFWRGNLADDFGLFGSSAGSEEFCLFQRNINPLTYEKLTKRTVTGGIRFYDFQCAAPKSVSIISLFDRRLVQAHEEAVNEAMRELEKLAAVRVRKGENAITRNYQMTGQIVYARFTHDTSRLLDPQLHTHNVVVNVTKDEDGSYKALETLEMCRAIRYAGKVYHNHLARKCRELGYETRSHRDEKGRIVWFDLEGVSEEIMELYSKRRKEIEEQERKFIEEHGRKPTLAENNFLSMTTRESKMKTSDREKVRRLQLSQLRPEQLRELNQVVWAARNRGSITSPGDIALGVQMIREALPQLYERETVLRLDKVLAETLNRNLGRIDLQTLKNAVPEVSELRNLGGLPENPWFSPQEVIDRELYAIEAVENQQGLFEPIAPGFQAFPDQESRRDQARIITALLQSKDRYNLFRGVAGSGKTSTLQELCWGLRSDGIQHIYLIAPTNSAVDVLKQEGFERSSTVTSFLQAPEKPPSGSYVIIDESGLNSLREGAEIIRIANENNYRVLFVGDARQHSAVESGDFFRLLEHHSKIACFSLSAIQRQKVEQYRNGITYCASGYFELGFSTLDEGGFIHEGKNQYLKNAAESYLEFTENGRHPERSILAAPTHEECDSLTEAVRERLKEAGTIAREGRTTQVFRSWQWEKARIADSSNYHPGMAVSFVRKMKDIADAGEAAVVESVSEGILNLSNGKSISLRRSAGFIEVGEFREIELCPGDIIQFGVNLKDRKIYNGNLAMITGDPEKIVMLNSDGTPREPVDFPKNCAAISHGWVTTSYKSQGRTADTVVAAAQKIDQKSFYVALSRGRMNMALHCPDKEFLKQQLLWEDTRRTSVHDLVRKGEISAGCLKHELPDEVKELAAGKRPDMEYKSVDGRWAKLQASLKGIANRVMERGRRIATRRARNSRYGFGIVTEKTLFETEREHAVETVPAEQAVPKPEVEKTSMSPIDEAKKWLQELKRRNMTKTQEVKTESPRETKPAAAVEPVKLEPIVLKAKHPRQEESCLRPATGVDDVREWLAELKRKTIAKRAAQAKEIQKPEAVPITPEPPEILEKPKIVPSPEKTHELEKGPSRGMDL